ncbi:type II secretion system GspH family protein [SCandidatus Aminicenantes bacterium Aminicenantia_JdfR_composite]|jgi:type II secretory pathway pseudopilin PulG|nr:type II secretion system GspH family protein [SCandidatus Aminicenantes bacterium Aminicenantia_JdfR_composite]MCP2597223.1 type II secretion system GspH family protein [Candidatus Aminicenantes bacterium AC-335-G13]MCP2597721.1 type II secretion system GspH family protein [Candidatus Aminicenantes bacterium AC-335-L06]
MKNKGYALIALMILISVMSILLLTAVPVWQTIVQREKEEELIFRGKQYVEAIRLYQLKHPGAFPRSLEELYKEKCIRKLYRDPMTDHGKWYVILLSSRISGVGIRGRLFRGRGYKFNEVILVPEEQLDSIEFPQIIGVASRSSKKSIKIYLNQDQYDKWLFFYGQDPKRMPRIIYYGKPK